MSAERRLAKVQQKRTARRQRLVEVRRRVRQKEHRLREARAAAERQARTAAAMAAVGFPPPSDEPDEAARLEAEIEAGHEEERVLEAEIPHLEAETDEIAAALVRETLTEIRERTAPKALAALEKLGRAAREAQQPALQALARHTEQRAELERFATALRGGGDRAARQAQHAAIRAALNALGGDGSDDALLGWLTLRVVQWWQQRESRPIDEPPLGGEELWTLRNGRLPL